MKQICLLALFTFLQFHLQAQQYKCFAPGQKTFYTNSYGYLRGIRIDSVKTSGSVTYYYPYKTLRGDYDVSKGSVLAVRGSWVGEVVAESADGTFLFDNLWGDTVTIKTQASLNQSWSFYNDNSNKFYNATVTAIDTLSVLGIPDSAKVISISAHSTTGPLPADPLNAFKIILTKHHGFAQVFDLYSFPYHAPGQAFTRGKDFFLDKSIDDVGNGGYPRDVNALFSIVDFHYPRHDQLNNWNVNDVFEYKACPYHSGPFWPMAECPPQRYYLDTVKWKNNTATGVSYGLAGWSCGLLPVDFSKPPPYKPEYKKIYTTSTVAFNDTYLKDTSLLPEEYRQNDNFYFYKNDTSFCTISDRYHFTPNRFKDTMLVSNFEQPRQWETYKDQIGVIHTYFFHPTLYLSELQLVYVERSGQACGDFFNLGVGDPGSNDKTVRIFPNPANDRINIETLSNVVGFMIRITDAYGRQIFSGESSLRRFVINTENFPCGLYFLNINSADSGTLTEKIIIQH